MRSTNKHTNKLEINVFTFISREPLTAIHLTWTANRKAADNTGAVNTLSRVDNVQKIITLNFFKNTG